MNPIKTPPSVPRFNAEIYDRYSVPVFLEPYALELVRRMNPSQLNFVLEIACGTGALTKHLIKILRPGTLTASDLSSNMLEFAKQKFPNQEISWILADASQLPFENDQFDLVICQFGYMFAPDKQQAFREAHRVLRKGGSLPFDTWDEVKYNGVNQLVQQLFTQTFGELPQECFVPFSLHDPRQIHSMLEDEGFSDITIEVVPKDAIAATAMNATISASKAGIVYNEIMKRDPEALPDFIDRVHRALKEKFGDTPMAAPMRAIISRGWKR
jgi:ubiquinone/menaquinone biosynthesis C-methylase UbiE